MSTKNAVLLAGALVFASPSVMSVELLYDWGFNVDGTTYCKIGPCDNESLDPSLILPGAIDASGFNFTTGLGSIEATITGAGSHSFLAFLDHEIDQLTTGFDNENGSATGVPALGQTWEIDEPGWTFGDIFDNFLADTLDNANGVPVGSEDDVSMGMGFAFDLLSGETASILLDVTTVAPASGFFLTHADPDADKAIYFAGSLSIRGPGPRPTPIPATVLLVGAGLLSLGGAMRFRKK